MNSSMYPDDVIDTITRMLYDEMKNDLVLVENTEHIENKDDKQLPVAC